MRNPFSAMRAACVGLCALAAASAAQAFDYRDGSVRDTGADIASLYAFVPNIGGEPGPLTVALAIKPFGLSVSEVGKDTEYVIRMRRATLAGAGPRLRSRVGTQELRISCNYYEHEYEISCVAAQVGADGSERVMGHVSGDIGETLGDNKLRAVTMMRSDPLLTNFYAQWHCLDDGEAEFNELDDAFKRRVHRKFRNSVEFFKMNVAAIIVEVDRTWLPQEAGMPLVAVAAQSVDVDVDGNRTVRDRVGRPGTSMFLIQDDQSRDGWNTVDPFDAAGATAHRDAMQLGMTAIDSHSRHNYWDYPHPLLELMLSDHLLLNPNVAVPAVDDSRNLYFEIEWAAFKGRSIEGLAGGRRPIDNAISRFFAVFARQANSHFAQLEALKHPLYRQLHARFPYLAAPYEKVDTLFGRAIEEMNPRPHVVHGCEN